MISPLAHAGPLADKAGVTEAVREQATQQAEGWFKRKVGRGLQKGLNYLAPGAGDALGEMIGLGSVEDKVERIEKKQDTAIGQIRGIAFQALATKKKLEQLYYYKKQAERNAKEMLRGIKDSDPRKFIGGFGEDMLGIPLNPAEYIPDTEYTRDLKANLAMDFSLERGLVQQGGFLLSETRAALASDEGLERQRPEEFNKAYQQAVTYEENLERALHAKEQATLKWHQQEIRRLESELKVLEASKGKPGLTMGDALQIERTVEMKRSIARDLHEKVNTGIREEMAMSDEQASRLLQKKQGSDVKALDDYFKHDRERVKRHYGHLWKFW
ncbi:MAG: hypothetical protein AAF963_02370 [Bacteroidota bacterium]